LKHVLSLIPEIAATPIAHHQQGILLMRLRLDHPVRCEPVYLFGRSPPVCLLLEYLILVLLNDDILLDARDC